MGMGDTFVCSRRACFISIGALYGIRTEAIQVLLQLSVNKKPDKALYWSHVTQIKLPRKRPKRSKLLRTSSSSFKVRNLLRLPALALCRATALTRGTALRALINGR